MVWHRNHAISHSPNQNFFEDTFVSHPGGPNEQFGTHEKLSWGMQGNLNWMPGYNALMKEAMGQNKLFQSASLLMCNCTFAIGQFLTLKYQSKKTSSSIVV